jgi:excisionase family DNA binding protein
MSPVSDQAGEVMGSDECPEDSATAKRLKMDFIFRRLVAELNKLNPDRKEALMRLLDEEDKGSSLEPVMVRPDDVAKILGVHSSTIRRWLRAGRIRGVKISRTWLIPRAEVERILSSGT